MANRVSDLQHTIDAKHWKYVPSKQNPADIASRGQSIDELKDSSLWWHGPSFLLNKKKPSPSQNYKLLIDTAPEKKKNVKVLHVIEFKQNYKLSK